MVSKREVINLSFLSGLLLGILIFRSKLNIYRIVILISVRNGLHEIGRHIPRTLKTETKNPIKGRGIHITNYDIKQKNFSGSNKKTSNRVVE